MKSWNAFALFVSLIPGLSAQPAAPVSLRVSEETVPAGGVAQLKVFLTEPKPIIRTGFAATYEEAFLGDILGIAAGGDLTGAAVIRNGQLRVELSSLNPGGLGSDYPLLTIAVRTRLDLPIGASVPVSLDLANSFWLNAAGHSYVAEAKPGSVTIGGSMYIADVLPGGGTLMPGDTFRVLGEGFVDGVKVNAEGARLQEFTSTELRMAAKQRIVLDGNRIRVELPNRERLTYYSYHRGLKTAPSAHPALQGMMPVFCAGGALQAMVALSTDAAVVNAIGLQNPTSQPVQLELDAVSILGQPLLNAQISIGAGDVVFRSAEELFGAALPPASNALLVRSTGAVQLAAAQVDTATGAMRAPSVVTIRKASY